MAAQVSTVLFLAANPAGLPSVRLDEECRAIEHKIRTAKFRSLVRLRSCWAARPDDLLQALNEETPSVLHFSGHGGGEPGLCFQSDDGGVVSVSAEDLALVMQAAGASVKIVVLNACYSEVQAQALIAHVPCVVGMPDAIDDAAATTYAAAFYRALAFGTSVANAHRQGLAALALDASRGTPRDVDAAAQPSVSPTPKLLVRADTHADSIYMVHPRSRRRLKPLTATLALLAAGTIAWAVGHRDPGGPHVGPEPMPLVQPDTSFTMKIRVLVPSGHSASPCAGTPVRLDLGNEHLTATIADNGEAHFPGVSRAFANTQVSVKVSCIDYEADPNALQFAAEPDATHLITLSPRCGNHHCDAGETHESCPLDCPAHHATGPCTLTAGNEIKHLTSTECTKLAPRSADAQEIASEAAAKGYTCTDIYRCM